MISSAKKPVVILGVSGSIAAYKAADVASRLVKEGAEVHVVMTEAAERFITPLTLQTLSRNPVVRAAEAVQPGWKPVHIALADVAALLTRFPRHRVLFGSDPPYGTVRFGMIMAARLAITRGWSAAELTDLFGGTIRRVLGESVSVPSGESWIAPALRHDIDVTHLDRAHRYLSSAIYASLHGGDPAEMLELTRHALALPAQHDVAHDAHRLRDMITVAEPLLAQPHRSAYWRSGLEYALHALVALATPELVVPTAPASGVA